MDEQIKFWADESRWPRDTTDNVFLCRAVLQTMKALYPDKWTNTEHKVTLVSKLPRHPFGLRDGELRNVYFKLKHLKSELNLPILTDTIHHLAKPQFTDEQWSAAVELYDKLNAETKGPYERFKAAKSKLFEALADGTVKSCLRPQHGGEFSNFCPVAWWNTERWGNRFFWGQMNPGDPFGNGIGGENYKWIFIDKATLETFLAGLRDDVPFEIALNAKAQEANEPVAESETAATIAVDGAGQPSEQVAQAATMKVAPAIKTRLPSDRTIILAVLEALPEAEAEGTGILQIIQECARNLGLFPTDTDDQLRLGDRVRRQVRKQQTAH